MCARFEGTNSMYTFYFRVFSREEIRTFRDVKFSDVIRLALDFDDIDIQDDVFHWKDSDPCAQPHQSDSDVMEECTPHRGFDYFSGSEVSFITAFTCLGLVPIGQS